MASLYFQMVMTFSSCKQRQITGKLPLGELHDQ